LVHEFGHIIVARLLRRPTETTIGGAGGRTVVFGPALKTWQRVLVLFSGILASYLLTEGMAWLLQKGLWPHVVVHETLFSIYTFSAVWFWCNLLTVERSRLW
jgi:membrane-associated protease RseP (regulator of RpoE activity)